MEKKEKSSVFIQNPNKKDRILVFQDKLKRHLSSEYLYIVDKRDDLENQIVQLKVEQSQKNKTLFPNIEQKDVRKYFSPLNIQEIEDDQKDEKDKQLLISIERMQDEISQLSYRMSEIKEFLHDIDFLLNTSDGSHDDNHLADVAAISYKSDILSSDTDSFDKNQNLELYFWEKNEQRNDNRFFPQNGDGFTDIVDYLSEKKEVYPQMLRNLYDFSDFLKKKFNQIEVLIEFNDNNIETSLNVNRNILSQLNYNVDQMLADYDISTILIQGEIIAKCIKLSLNYVCDTEDIDAMSVSYEIDYR